MKPDLKHFCIAAITMLALSSCSKIYTPVLYHQDIAYMPKPASFDSVSTRVYASVGGAVRTDTYFEDMIYSGQADLSVGHTFKNFNLAYGAFGELGDYKNSNQDHDNPNYFSDRTYGAIGGRFSANLYKKIDRVDFRYIGVEAAYSHEFGDFTTFKKNLQPESNYYVDQRINLFTMGLTTEVVFHPANNIKLQHGFRVFLGVTLGHNELNSTIHSNDSNEDRLGRELFPKISYFINYKHCFGIVDAGNGFMGRFGYRF